MAKERDRGARQVPVLQKCMLLVMYCLKCHFFVIIIIILTYIFFQDLSMVWPASSQQHKVDNQSLVFSHHKAVVYPWEYRNKVLVTGCSSCCQPARIREEMLECGNLFSHNHHHLHQLNDHFLPRFSSS